MTGRVLVVGSANLDHVVRVAALPEPGATVAGHDYRTGPGGKGLNQAVAAARQGAAVTLVAAIGADEAGDELLAVLRRAGVGTGSVRRLSGVPTGVALIAVADDGSNQIVVAAGANGHLSAGDVPGAEQLGGVGVVLTQLEVPLDAVEAALRAGRAAGAVTVLNPAPAPPSLPRALLELVDVLVPNETEAIALTGASDVESAGRALARSGGGSVVVTLGSAGSLFIRGGAAEVVRVPPFAVSAVDTTGAGDAYCGTLAAALAAGADLEAALRRAAAAGALATTRAGAATSAPARDEVDRLLAEQG